MFVGSRLQTISPSAPWMSICATRPSRAAHCFLNDSLGSAAGPLASCATLYPNFAVATRSAWPARGTARCTASTRSRAVPAGAASPAAGSQARPPAGSSRMPMSACATNGGSARPTETTSTSSTLPRSPTLSLQPVATGAWPAASVTVAWNPPITSRCTSLCGGPNVTTTASTATGGSASSALTPTGSRWHPHHPAVRAAIHPDTVTLTGLLVSPHWLRVAASLDHADHQRFYDEAARRLNLPAYQPYTGWDPLARWIDRNASQQFRESASPQTNNEALIVSQIE
jgi:hypothetical protein